ncbi:hypothetical protein CUU87_15840 [Salmonella enterica subsp. enterica serovar Typhimurium]|nr:hypothetical protein [Salmonella enterica subsp. enterica serovar Typhimurium]
MIKEWTLRRRVKKILESIPRNDKGWPTIEVEDMTVDQLKAEAAGWCHSASKTARGTMSNIMWGRYYDELVKRGVVLPENKYDYLPMEF